MRHSETHRAESTGWLRAAVLGANDGLISTASLIVGVASATPDLRTILLAGAAGLVAGAFSMAAGEYVSVSSQADSEEANLAKERHELATLPDAELRELTSIYVGRGLSADLAHRVAQELMAHDALAAHARDELGIWEQTRANPVQAAFASAGAFACGAGLPLLVVTLVPIPSIALVIAGVTLALLLGLGALAARLGGAPPATGAMRVAFWGMAAMGASALAGKLFGAIA